MLCGTGNRVRLSTTSGTVSENGRIVSIENAVEESASSAFVNFGLSGIVVEDAVESENLVLDLLR